MSIFVIGKSQQTQHIYLYKQTETDEHTMSPMASLDMAASLTSKSKALDCLTESFDELSCRLSSIKQPHSMPDLTIRFLIFIEDSEGARSNIFDSSRFVKKTNGNSSAFSGSNWQLSSSSSSQKLNQGKTSESSKEKTLNNQMLTRMVFGSFPMVVTNRTAIKVHSLK